ncbi:MAG: hypothetical protein ACYDD1_06380 [Caulobacteraceae bacterium]
MPHDMQTVRDDLAFIKALAQEGRRAPLLNGRILLATGVIYGAASLGEWAMAVGVLQLPRAWLWGVWLLATAIFYPLLWSFRRASCGRPGASAVNNVAAGAAWRGLGYAVLTMVVATGLAAWREHSAIVWDTFPCAVLVFYGAGWMVAAAMSQLAWVRWVAAGCLICAVAVGVVAGTPASCLVFAAGCLLLVALPGWLLLRQEPSDIV